MVCGVLLVAVCLFGMLCVLFVGWCSLLVVCCLPVSGAYCVLMRVVFACCLLVVVLLFMAWCVLRDACCVVCVVCSGWLLFVGVCFLLVAGCCLLLFVVCCLLFVDG